MDEEAIEKRLAELFERRLSDFFAKSIPEKLEETAKHFDEVEVGQRINGDFVPNAKIHFHTLKAVLEIVSELIEGSFDKNAHPPIKEFYLRMQNRALQNYLVHKWQEAFFLLTPLFVATFYLFDENNSKILTEESRYEMLSKLDLTTAKKRNDVCLDYLKQLLLDEIVTHGGSKGFWDEIKRIQFLAHYNRYFFVIKNADSDFKKLKKLGQKTSKILEQIKDKFGIPKEFIEDFLIPLTPAERALEWAKLALQAKDTNENIRSRVLTLARKEFIAMAKGENPRALVHVEVENNRVTGRYVVDPENKKQIAKLRFFPDEPKIETI